MAWNGRQTAEEILGMKPEDLRTRLDSSVTKEEFQAQQAKLDEQTSTLSEMREMLKALSTPKPQEVHIEESDPNIDILVDPNKFITSRMLPLANAQMETQAQMQEMRARQGRHAGVFAQYGDELMTSAKSFNAATRAGDGFWDFHIAKFLGDKYIKGEIRGTSYPSLLGSSQAGVNHDGSRPDPNKGFDPEMADFFRERNVPIDKAATIKKLIDDGEPISLESYRKAKEAKSA
jgi:hypothetical protein